MMAMTLKEVKNKGATAALVSKLQNNSDLQQIVVPDTLFALKRIANFWRKIFEIPVIAITGSNGNLFKRTSHPIK